MEKKMMMAVALALLVMISFNSNTLVVESQGVNCYDSCNTGCVNPDPRLYRRCDRKCQIRCGPGNKATGGLD
jgi:hypothetical protein